MVRRNNSHLPRKTCAVCGREFAWRKKWAKDWQEVRYCSERCRRRRSRRGPKSDAGFHSSDAGGP
ncbi:MAG: DUF2256 domain-containing protein [Fimbriimonadaceae bacterium]